MYCGQSQQVEEKILGKRNSFTMLVTVNYMFYRILCQWMRITKDDYDEIVGE